MDEKLSVFSKWLSVQAYKHNGSLHRQWSPAYVALENEDFWAIVSKSSLVTESDGRRWMTKEHAVFVLFKKRWLNVICMFKEGLGICYYANIASPTIFDKGYLKYIDYDLDLKLYPDRSIKILDEQEFKGNIDLYNYDTELVDIIRSSFRKAKELMVNAVFPFDDEKIKELFTKFLNENKPFVPHETEGR